MAAQHCHKHMSNTFRYDFKKATLSLGNRNLSAHYNIMGPGSYMGSILDQKHCYAAHDIYHQVYN